MLAYQESTKRLKAEILNKLSQSAIPPIAVNVSADDWHFSYSLKFIKKRSFKKQVIFKIMEILYSKKT